ncbi:MAG: class I SAM-dependent methyltransferase [Gammaproteobacteria bacterium]|nr:class I SAM-dependent methyltransferase [Gammaproteobacteria bacterium]
MEGTSTDNYAPVKSALPWAIGIQNFFLRRVRHSVLDMLQRIGARTVLDVCSGGGALAYMIQQRGMSVQAVDGSPTMAEYSRSQYGIIPKVARAEALPYHQQFDAAVIGMTLHELGEEQREQVWQRVEDAVKNTGIIIAVDYTVPPPSVINNMLSKLTTLDESNFDTVNPGHYQDYQRFMAAGGLVPWLQKRKGYFYDERTHLFGNIAVVAVMK